MSTRKKRREAPTVNAGSMADIAFLLLIFFLVTTTILEEQGVLVRLPVWIPDEEEVKIDLDEKKVLTVKINKQNLLLIENEPAEMRAIPALVERHVINPNFPPTEAVVSLTHDRGTSYDTYLEVYDALLLGYHRLRDERANKLHGKRYDELSKTEQKAIRKAIPLVISEAEPTEFGEG